MPFSETVELLIERAVGILNDDGNVIVDEFSRFNTIYVSNIKTGKVTFELQLTLPEIVRVMGYDLNRFYQDRDFNFEKTLEYRLWHYENIPYFFLYVNRTVMIFSPTLRLPFFIIGASFPVGMGNTPLPFSVQAEGFAPASVVCPNGSADKKNYRNNCSFFNCVS